MAKDSLGRCRACPVRDGCCFFAVPQFQALAEARFYGRNFTLFRQGDYPGYFMKMRNGWLQLTHLTANGKAVVDFAGPGSIFGVSELMTQAPFAVTAQTLEDCCLEVVEAGRFLAFLDHHPVVATRVLRCVSKQLRAANETVFDVIVKVSSEQRLLRALQQIADSCGSRVSNGALIRLPVTVQDLADKIGCSRQWTSKLLNDLQRSGLLERDGGWIVITSAGIARKPDDRGPVP